MSNALDKIKKIASTEKSSWLDEAKERWQNKAWRKYSFQIAARILIEIRNQKPINGMTQKLLAEKMGVAPQYINKVVKGKENLTLETISKFEKILGITLIDVKKPELSDESKLLDDEITFISYSHYSHSDEYKSYIQKFHKQKTEDNIKYTEDELNKIFEKIDPDLLKSVFWKRGTEVSDSRKEAIYKYFYALIHDISQKDEQDIIEIENFTLYPSETNKKAWEKHRILKHSKKSKYEHEG